METPQGPRVPGCWGNMAAPSWCGAHRDPEARGVQVGDWLLEPGVQAGRPPAWGTEGCAATLAPGRELLTLALALACGALALPEPVLPRPPISGSSLRPTAGRPSWGLPPGFPFRSCRVYSTHLSLVPGSLGPSCPPPPRPCHHPCLGTLSPSPVPCCLVSVCHSFALQGSHDHLGNTQTRPSRVLTRRKAHIAPGSPA